MVISLICIITLDSCSEGKVTNPTKEVVKMAILETDLGSSMDDLFAMDMLYAADANGLVDFKAIMINREGLHNLRIVDIMNTYYGQTDVLIGNVRNAPQNTTIFIDYWKMAMPEIYNDEPQFARSLTDEQLEALPYAEELYRELLSAAPDTSVVVFSVGFATNLAHLLQTDADQYSPLNGVELVKKKVKALYIQAGHFGHGEEPDYNFTQDAANAKILMDRWPTEIWFSPQETGDRFNYKPEEVLADFEAAGLTDSPIYHAYDHHQCSTGQRMWDVCAVLQFLHPELFSIKGPVHYDIDNEMILHEKEGDRHYMTYTETEEQYYALMQLIQNRFVPNK